MITHSPAARALDALRTLQAAAVIPPGIDRFQLELSDELAVKLAAARLRSPRKLPAELAR